MNNKLSENLSGYETVAVEMQRLLEYQYQAIEAIKSTGRQLLTSASLIVALIGVLQIFNVQPASNMSTIYKGLLIVSAILYVGLVVYCVKVIHPIDLYAPTSSNWDDLWRKFIYEKTDKDVFMTRISGYINVISKNRPIIEAKKRHARIASLLLPTIVVLLFVASILPRL